MSILERNSSTKAAFTTRSVFFWADLRHWVYTGVCERLFCSVVFWSDVYAHLFCSVVFGAVFTEFLRLLFC